MNMMEFGEIITNERQNRHMTQEELAKKLGVTAQAVSKWERGQSLPDIDLLSGICKVMEISSDDILGLSIPSKRINENDSEREKREIRYHLLAEPLVLRIGKKLVEVVNEGVKGDKIFKKRCDIARETGILIPLVRLVDYPGLSEYEYRVVTFDKEIFAGVIAEEHQSDNGAAYGQMIDDMAESVVKNYEYILNRELVKDLVDNVAERYPAAAVGIVPDQISYSMLRMILVGILKKGMYIHNLIKILEAASEFIEFRGAVNSKDLMEECVDYIIDCLKEQKMDA